jgi:uncharacterized protein
MKRDEIADRVRALYAAFASGDPAAYRSAFAADVVWHVPGDNPVSGAYRGPNEYFGTMVERMAPLDEWSFAVQDVLVNEQDRAALVRLHLLGARRGARVDMGGYHLIRLDEDGKVIEGWGFTEDQASLDAFFSA